MAKAALGRRFLNADLDDGLWPLLAPLPPAARCPGRKPAAGAPAHTGMGSEGCTTFGLVPSLEGHLTTSGMAFQGVPILEPTGPLHQRPRRVDRAHKPSGLQGDREQWGLWLSGSPQGVRLSIFPPGWGKEPGAPHMNADSPVRAGQNYKLSCPRTAFSCCVLGQGLGEGLLCGPASLNLLQ